MKQKAIRWYTQQYNSNNWHYYYEYPNINGVISCTKLICPPKEKPDTLTEYFIDCIVLIFNHWYHTGIFYYNNSFSITVYFIPLNTLSGNCLQCKIFFNSRRSIISKLYRCLWIRWEKIACKFSKNVFK